MNVDMRSLFEQNSTPALILPAGGAGAEAALAHVSSRARHFRFAAGEETFCFVQVGEKGNIEAKWRPRPDSTSPQSAADPRASVSGRLIHKVYSILNPFSIVDHHLDFSKAANLDVHDFQGS